MEIRSLETQYQSKDNIVEGIAIKFNSISNILYDKANKRYFREVIDSNAITQDLIDRSYIKFLFNHDKEKLLARRKNGEGSLNVELREDGVYFSFECPNTTIGNDLKEQIRRGDISTCSFAFVDGEVTWDLSNREYPLRTVKSIRALYDLSAVYDAAYDSTEISTRSIEELMNKDVTKVTENNSDWKKELEEYRKRIGKK